MMEENGMFETVSFIISGAVKSAEKAFYVFLDSSDPAMLFWWEKIYELYKKLLIICLQVGPQFLGWFVPLPPGVHSLEDD